MSHKFLIQNNDDKTYSAGPFGRKKARRIYDLFTSTDGEKYSMVREDVATDWDGVYRDPEGGRSRKGKKRGGWATPGEEKAQKILLENPTHEKYKYRTGLFKQREPVEDLMERLEITDYEIGEKTKGFYANYND